jgi:hypothetical protein
MVRLINHSSDELLEDTIISSSSSDSETEGKAFLFLKKKSLAFPSFLPTCLLDIPSRIKTTQKTRTWSTLPSSLVKATTHNNKKHSLGSSSFSSIKVAPSVAETTVPSAPPKRSKISRVKARRRRVQPIERDEYGNPKLPQQIGVLTVVNLGRIETKRGTFHNERYIFPIGYSVKR